MGSRNYPPVLHISAVPPPAGQVVCVTEAAYLRESVEWREPTDSIGFCARVKLSITTFRLLRVHLRDPSNLHTDNEADDAQERGKIT